MCAILARPRGWLEFIFLTVGRSNINNIVSAPGILLKKTLWPLFMDGVQLPQGYRATTRRQFTFYH